MNHDEVQRWLNDYVAAWSASDPEAIRALFAAEAAYGYRPWDGEKTTVKGNDDIVASWLENPDDPSSWEASYAPYAVDGDRAVALGTTRYLASGDHPERTYHNAFVLRFDDDGKCVEFHEFYVAKKD
jgi:ketosteroid isomerase-like protein